MATTILDLAFDLRTLLGDEKVFLPGCKEYQTAIKRWAASIEKPAGLVVYPTSSQDVATTVQLATKYSVPFTCVCGGHGTSGDSSIKDGLLINLRRMNTVTANPEKLTVTSAGGAIWGEIDQVAAAHGLSCVGGTVNQTGVAGYTTGGGFGWLSGRFGLAIDNLLAAEIVLADGRIVICSATQEPDLFWAIRGAGHMFGIITSFTFRAHPQPNNVYGGMVVFSPTPEAINHLITFANYIQSTSDGRTAMFAGFTTPAFMPGKRVIFGCCFHDGPENEGRAIFAPLVENSPVPPLKNTLTSLSYPAMNEVLAVAAQSEGRRVSKGACYEGQLPPAAFQKVLDMYEDFVANVCPEAGESGACLFEFYPLDAVCSVSATATAFINRQRHSNAMIIPRWRSAKYDDVCRRFTRDAMDALKKSVNDFGGVTGEYLNYDGLGTPAEKIFGENYPRLVAVKTRYDPKNVFSKRQGLRAPETREEEAREEKAKLDEDSVAAEVEEKNGQLTPPESDNGQKDGRQTLVTHEVVISTREGEDASKTEEIVREVRKAVSRVEGANVLVRTELDAS